MPNVTDTECSVTVCKRTNACCRHRQTGDVYCPRCARKINDANPMPDKVPLVLFPITVVECGCCSCYHLVGFRGDCRDDANRFADVEDASKRHHGAPVIEVYPPDDEHDFTSWSLAIR